MYCKWSPLLNQNCNEKNPLLAVHPGNANLPSLAKQTVDFRRSLTHGLVAPATLPKLL